MHIKILNKYYFINKFNQSHIDKQDKRTIIIFRNYDQKVDELSARIYYKITRGIEIDEERDTSWQSIPVNHDILAFGAN